MPAWMSLKYAPVRSLLSSLALASSSHLLSEFIIVTGDTPLTERVTSAAAALRIWITVCISLPALPAPLERCMVVVVVVVEDMLLLLLTRKTIERAAARRSRGGSPTWNLTWCRRVRRVQDRPVFAYSQVTNVASWRAGECTREPTLSSMIADSR
jgi:hypothetical protein